MNVLVVVAAALLALGLPLVTAVDAARVDQRQRHRRALTWRELARRRGGTCKERFGQIMAATPPDWVDVRVAHALVRLDRTTRDSGDKRIGVTRARARFALGAGPTFEVPPAGVSSTFVVKGSDLDAIHKVWTLPLQQACARRFPAATVHSDGTHVTLMLPGTGEAISDLDAMLDLVGGLASAGASEFEALAALAEVTLQPPSGPRAELHARRLSLATAHGDATATLKWLKSTPCLWLTLPSKRKLPHFRVVVENGTADGLAKGLLSEHAQRLLSQLEGVLLLSDESGLDVRWGDIPTPDALIAGAKLLGEIAGATHRVGAFR